LLQIISKILRDGALYIMATRARLRATRPWGSVEGTHHVAAALVRLRCAGRGAGIHPHATLYLSSSANPALMR
jgi:hypothetical protein